MQKKIIAVIVMLSLALSISFSVVGQTDSNYLEGIECSCGGNLFESNREHLEEYDSRVVSCPHSEYMNTDIIYYYRVYNSWLCDTCGSTYKRDFVGTRTRTYCNDSGRWYT